MGLISNKNKYPLDVLVSNDDYLIGTDSDNSNQTVNFSVRSLLNLVSENIGIPFILLKFSTSLEASSEEGVFNSNSTSYASLTNLKISKKDLEGIDLDPLLDVISSNKEDIIISIKDNLDNFGYFVISSFVEFTSYYDFQVSSLGSIYKGSLIDGNTYTFDYSVYNNNQYTLSSLSGNVFSLLKDGNVVSSIDLSSFLDNTNLARVSEGSLNPLTGIITLTRDDLTTIEIDISSLNIDLSYFASPTEGVINNSNGDDATIPSGSTVNASLMTPSDKIKLDGVESGAKDDQSASEVPVSFSPTNYTPATPDVEAHLESLDSTIEGFSPINTVIPSDPHPVTSGELYNRFLRVHGLNYYDTGYSFKGLNQPANFASIVYDKDFILAHQVGGATNDIYILVKKILPQLDIEVNNTLASGSGVCAIGLFNTLDEVPLGDPELLGRFDLSTSQNIAGLDESYYAFKIAGTFLYYFNFSDFGQSLALSFNHVADSNPRKSTGVIEGLELSINADPTKFDISPGSGEIYDNELKEFKKIVISSSIIGTLADSLAVPSRFILIDKDSNIVQLITPPTAKQKRENIYLGILVSDGAQLFTGNNDPDALNNTTNSLYDFMDAIGNLNQDNNITFTTADLSFNLIGGYLFGRNINYSVDKNNPHKKTISDALSISHRRATQSGTIFTPATQLDPLNYDEGGVITPISGTNNRAQNMRVWLFPDNNVVVQYGQEVYNTLEEAIGGLTLETSYIVPNDIKSAGVLIGYISVIKGATDLLNNPSEVQFTASGIFGEKVVSAGALVETDPTVAAHIKNILQSDIDTWDSALQSVVGGTNINIDNTDPLNPIVSSTDTNVSNSDLVLSQTRYLTVPFGTSYVFRDAGLTPFFTLSPLSPAFSTPLIISNAVNSNEAVAKNQLDAISYAQVSAGEIVAGTETALRVYSPADIVSLINTHASLSYGIVWNNQTADYEAVLADAEGKVIKMDSPAIENITLNSTVGFNDGDIITITTVDSDVRIAYSGTYTGELFSTDVANGIKNLAVSLQGTTWYPLTNNYATYTLAPVNLFPTGNAASPDGDEADATTGWSGVDATVSSVSTPTAQNGTYAILVEATNNDGNDRGQIVISGLDAASSYTLSYYAYQPVGTDGAIQISSTELDGAQYLQSLPTGGTWVQYTSTINPSGTSVTLRVNAVLQNGVGSIGDQVLIDNITLTQD